jgi:hypothetical protein
VTRRPRRRSWLVVALVITVLGALLAGCKNPTVPQSQLQGCSFSSDAVSNALSSKLHKGAGTLRNVKQITTGGTTFVSAELHAPGDKKHDKGDILTWAATTAKDPTEFTSVDVHAREKSSWPGSKFNVTQHGVYASRECTNLTRGKTKAQIQCEEKQNGNANGGPSFNTNNNCGNL